MRFSIYLAIFIITQSCVSTTVFDDAQVVGKGNLAIEGSLNSAIYSPEYSPSDVFSRFYRDREQGMLRTEVHYGVTKTTEVGGGIDLPVGFNLYMKQLVYSGGLKHLHSLKMDLNLPVVFQFVNTPEIPILMLTPSYLYTYRYDDLLSFSTNAYFQSIQTNQRLTHIPGVGAGIHVGDELRFSAGIHYFNNFSSFGAQRIQYLSASASIQYDL